MPGLLPSRYVGQVRRRRLGLGRRRVDDIGIAGVAGDAGIAGVGRDVDLPDRRARPIGSPVVDFDTPMNDDPAGFDWSLMSGTYRYQLPLLPCCTEGAHRWSGLNGVPSDNFDCTQWRLWYWLSSSRVVGPDQVRPSVEK